MTELCAAFCGTGKTYMCDKSSGTIVEFECWKYQGNDFPNNYIVDIKSKIGEADIIFISTNLIVLKEFIGMDLSPILVYPEIGLKSEYLQRYKERGSSESFIETTNTYWNDWINELQGLKGCSRIVLGSGEFVSERLGVIAPVSTGAKIREAVR